MDASSAPETNTRLRGEETKAFNRRNLGDPHRAECLVEGTAHQLIVNDLEAQRGSGSERRESVVGRARGAG